MCLSCVYSIARCDTETLQKIYINFTAITRKTVGERMNEQISMNYNCLMYDIKF